MNERTKQMALAVVSALVIVRVLVAGEAPAFSQAADKTQLDRLVGQPVDIAPWAYEWRADRAVQEKPEAYFIPRRLERMDRVYRTAFSTLPEQELKSIHYQMPDLLKPLLPKPKGMLLAGLLWTGRLTQYQVELHWSSDVREIPSPEAVEVRVYPSSYGWFGWTVDKVLSKPEVSGDRLTWTYKSGPAAKMDWAYNLRVDAATEMVAVFCEEGSPQVALQPAVPSIRVICPDMGAWRRMDVEIEWGFHAGEEKADFDGWVESYVGVTGPVVPLAEDTGTTMTGLHSWRSRAAGDMRRGIVLPLLYSLGGQPALDGRVTVCTKTAGFSFRLRDLDNGPILIPEHGVFLAKIGIGKTARQFAGELAARNLKSIRQMIREHREAASWEEVMREVRLWTCPAGTAVPPFPPVEDPPMQVQLPDLGWVAAWRAASFQLKGKHMWGGLAFEVGQVAHEMDLVGLHDEADKVYQHFLKAPGSKSDGDYADGKGALEWATAMRHDMGYNHDGTHASTGRLLFAMADRYFLTGDKEWFQRNRDRMQAAADWIIRQRSLYMKDLPNRQDLLVAGLMPPCMLGDYAMPSCDWHWYYVDDALSLQGVQRFADALREIDPEAGRKYLEEAEAFRRDIRRTVDREAALGPVRLGRDGTFRSFIPRMAYARGLTGPELGAPQFPECDLFMGALPLAEPFAVLDAGDRRMVGTLDVMEELGTSATAVREREEARKKKGLSADDACFWNCYVSLPKASHNANIYLLQDDVPNFLRFWMNSYAAMVGADGKLWEHWHLGSYTDCSAPDNGTAGWFMENFRNLLVMEEGLSLWVARATPRVWLEQGKKIAIANAPTYFGALAYEIVSDVDHDKITASIEVPSRVPPKSVIVRIRHPKAAPIRSVMVNGRPWSGFDKDREVIELVGLTGKVAVVAGYDGSEGKHSDQQPTWNKIWENEKVDASIRSLIGSIDTGRMSKHLFYLSKDPLPCRKLNYTLPGHAKSTLDEADDYLVGLLESWGYRVEREGARVQAFRRDVSKRKHEQYSLPKPEDPWYTAYNLYAEKKGLSRPDEIILVIAHKDSQSWIDSPGANDNAIGTVGVLEMACVLAKGSTERTVRFLFCNEEHTPWTSLTAAQKAKARGDRIVAVFNTDGIGAKSAEQIAAKKMTNVTAYSEPAGERLAELMGVVCARYVAGLEQRAVKRTYPNDDDGSFVKAGYPAAIVNIGSWPYGDPNYHGEGDIPERCDVPNAALAVQAVLAAILTVDRDR